MSDYHAYLLHDIPRDIWNAAVARAGRTPMKFVLHRLLEDYANGTRSIPATLPQEPRSELPRARKPSKAKNSQPAPVAKAESPILRTEADIF